MPTPARSAKEFAGVFMFGSIVDRRVASPHTARNREPILAVMRRVFPENGKVLEIASGSGEHAVFVGRALPGLV